jgi:hypothetical protein
LFAAFGFFFGASTASADDAPLKTWTFGSDVLSIEHIPGYESFDQDLLTIRRSGKLIHAEVAPHFGFTTSPDGEADEPMLVAITSDAGKDLVIEAFSGGAHCCFSIQIVTLSDAVHVSPSLDLRDAGAALFKLPNSPRYGIRSADETFAYRWTSFASSPAPQILLRYDVDKGFTMATDLMRKPKMSAGELQKAAAKMRADSAAWKAEGDSPTAEYLGAVLDMIYAGDLKGAQVYAKAAWPDWKKGRNDFIDDLDQCALPASPWWTSVAELNGIKPYDAGKDCQQN